jgi:hypothetical protein
MQLVQLISIAIYSLIALWYVVPSLRKLGRAEALTAVLWVHVFRYLVLYIFTARREGYAIPDPATLELVVGDLTGAIIGLGAIILLRLRARLGLALSWLLVIETICDLFGAIYYRRAEPPRPEAIGPWWFIYAFFGPLILVSTVLLVWQLIARRNELLTDRQKEALDRAHRTTPAQPSSYLESTACQA